MRAVRVRVLGHGGIPLDGPQALRLPARATCGVLHLGAGRSDGLGKLWVASDASEQVPATALEESISLGTAEPGAMGALVQAIITR